jgi:hypothetical protein
MESIPRTILVPSAAIPCTKDRPNGWGWDNFLIRTALSFRSYSQSRYLMWISTWYILWAVPLSSAYFPLRPTSVTRFRNSSIAISPSELQSLETILLQRTASNTQIVFISRRDNLSTPLGSLPIHVNDPRQSCWTHYQLPWYASPLSSCSPDLGYSWTSLSRSHMYDNTFKDRPTTSMMWKGQPLQPHLSHKTKQPPLMSNRITYLNCLERKRGLSEACLLIGSSVSKD